MGSSNAAAAAVLGVVALFATALYCSPSYADDAPDLAKLAQNPIAKVISLPFQDNLTFGVGAGPRSAECAQYPARAAAAAQR